MPLIEMALPAPWQYYADRSREAHLGRADFFGLGREEQLWATLDVIERGVEFDDDCRKRLDRIPQNRSKKYLRLIQKLADFAHSSITDEPQLFELRDEIAVVERYLSDAERDIERRLAIGESYSEIAFEMRVTAAALKVRVSRWRQRVRRQFGSQAA